MPEVNLRRRLVVRLPDQRSDRRADLDAHAIALGREDARVRGTVRCDLPGLVLVAVQTVDPYRVEGLDVPFTHPGKGQAIQPRVVRNEGDNALPRSLGDPPLRHSEEANVQVIQTLALGLGHALRRAVRVGQFPLFLHGEARETVVRRIAQDDQNRRVPLHLLRPIPLLLQFREWKRLVRSRFPACKGIGQKDARPFRSVLCQWSVEVLHRQAHLQMGNDERCRHDLEAEDALRGGLLDPGASERSKSSSLEILRDAPQHLREIGPGSAARIEDVDVLRRQAVGNVQIVAERLVHPRNHVLHHLGRRVPDAQLLTECRVEGLQERLVEVRHRLALVEAGVEGTAIHPVQSRGRPVQHFDQAQRLQTAWVRKLLEQRSQHRRAKVPAGFPPVEHAATIGRLPRPQHSGREHSVEECLHKGRVEETRSLPTLEPHAERLLQG